MDNDNETNSRDNSPSRENESSRKNSRTSSANHAEDRARSADKRQNSNGHEEMKNKPKPGVKKTEDHEDKKEAANAKEYSDSESTVLSIFLSDGDEKRAQLCKLEKEIKIVRDEYKKINKHEKKSFEPNVFNDLKPYANTKDARRLFKEDKLPKYKPRHKFTAVSLVDPVVAHKMENVDTSREKVIPNLKKSEPTSKEEKEDLPPGSHKLPRMPRVIIDEAPYVNKVLTFNDVPRLREEAVMMYTAQGDNKKQEDFVRTKDDFRRMELHKLEKVHPASRKIMGHIYHAYLSNTPGSRRALRECIKLTEERIGEKILDLSEEKRTPESINNKSQKREKEVKADSSLKNEQSDNRKETKNSNKLKKKKSATEEPADEEHSDNQNEEENSSELKDESSVTEEPQQQESEKQENDD